MDTSPKPLSQNISQLESQLEDIFVKKVPALPENIKEIIVKISPYLAVVGVILGLPAVLTILGLGAIAAPFAVLGGYSSFTGLISVIFAGIIIVLEILAIPGLFSRSIKAWRFLYYSVLVSAVSNLISLNLGGLIIGTAISFYFLFQVKSYYK